MQVPRLGTRKKPRHSLSTSRHLRTELRSIPLPFRFLLRSRVCFPSRPRGSTISAKRSITICGPSFLDSAKILSCRRRGIFYSRRLVVSSRIVESYFADGVISRHYANMEYNMPLPGDYAFYLRQRDRIETADAARAKSLYSFEPRRGLMQPATLSKEAFNSVHMRWHSSLQRGS